MNISQHAIIPLGYPSHYGYYDSSGTLVNNGSTSIYRSLKKSGTYGCNKIYRPVPQNVSDNSAYYGIVRGWDVSSVEPVPSTIVSFNSPNRSVFDFNRSYDINSFTTSTRSIYASILNYPFFIFFKVNTPAVTSLSLGNPFSPDVMEDEEEMI